MTGPDPQAAERAPRKRPHICHIAATTSGASWLLEQVTGLRDRFGYDVTVILNGRSGKLVEQLEGAGVRVLASDFEFLGTPDLLALPKKVLDLARLLRRERFDLVQTHLFHSMVIGRLASWIADVPVRLSMIAGPFHLEAYTSRWIDGSTQWMETVLIPSCEHTRSLYHSLGVSDRRLRVIYYGADEAKFDPAEHQAADLRQEFGWSSDAPLIGMIAYFYAELGVNRWTPPTVQGHSVKCQADLIRALPAIHAEFPEAKLVLVGSGWEEPGRQHLARMRQLVRDLGLSDSVGFTGFRADIPEILKALDVTVQASASENLGGTIEALLMATPLVATRVGGLVDSVKDGRTGALAEPSDPASLAHAILRLLRDPAEARAMARRGRALMLERFTLRSTVEEEHRLYQETLAAASRGYRLWTTVFRLFVGGAVCALLAARYRIVDAYLLPRLDAGWRPWHFSGLRRRIRRLVSVLDPRRLLHRHAGAGPHTPRSGRQRRTIRDHLRGLIDRGRGP